MKKLISPKNEVELAMILGILEDEGIPHLVKNNFFASLLGGAQPYKYIEKAIMVDEAHFPRAKELLDKLFMEAEQDEIPWDS